MYQEILKAVKFINEKQPVRFSYLFKYAGLNLSQKDQLKLKDYLIADGIVENHEGEGNEFGKEADYSLTIYGENFYKEAKEFEPLDRILSFLSDHENRYFYMEVICAKHLKIPYNKYYEYKLINDQMVEIHNDRGAYLFKIAPAGEYHILNKGGYTTYFNLLMEEKIVEFRQSAEKGFPPQQVTQHIQTYFQNINSTIGVQGETIYESKLGEGKDITAPKREKKVHWLQIIAWIAAVIGVILTILKDIFKKGNMF